MYTDAAGRDGGSAAWHVVMTTFLLGTQKENGDHPLRKQGKRMDTRVRVPSPPHTHMIVHVYVFSPLGVHLKHYLPQNHFC